MSTLYRTQALAKISNPDQLDRVLQVVRPMHGLALATVAVVLAAAVVWSILATAPVKVQGQGILLSSQGVADVTAPATGRIQEFLVQVGDSVAAGQPVALLALPDTVDRLSAKAAELADARDQLVLLEAARSEYLAMQDDLVDAQGRTARERIATLQAQHARLQERRGHEVALRSKGFVTASRLNETDTRIAELENQIASLRNGVVEQNLQRQSDNAQREQRIRETALRVAALERELQNMEREYQRSRQVPARVAGTVVELNANTGELVNPGVPLMRLLATDASDDETLRAIIFVPNSDGKRVQVGMDAQVMPSTTKLQKDGFIRGTVLQVAAIPSTRDGMMRRLKNAALVDNLLRTGAPFEVEVELRRNPQAPSGYLWSSGPGPDVSVDVGTMARADMVVGRTRIVSLILPSFDHLFRWLGMH